MTTPNNAAGGVEVANLYAAASKGFHTSETCGLDGKYMHAIKFRSMTDLHAYEAAWRAAMIYVRDTALAPKPEGGVMADSIEVLRAALRYIEHTANGKQELLVEQMRNAIRALSPAGGDWVMVPREMTDAMIEPWLTPEQMAGGKSGGDLSPHAAVIRKYNRMLAASPQQEPGAVRDLTECGHSKYDPCHNCEPTTADESGPAINSAETYSKPIADPIGQTLAGAYRAALEQIAKVPSEPPRGSAQDRQISKMRSIATEALTATSAGTTGKNHD